MKYLFVNFSFGPIGSIKIQNGAINVILDDTLFTDDDKNDSIAKLLEAVNTILLQQDTKDFFSLLGVRADEVNENGELNEKITIVVKDYFSDYVCAFAMWFIFNHPKIRKKIEKIEIRDEMPIDDYDCEVAIEPFKNYGIDIINNEQNPKKKQKLIAINNRLIKPLAIKVEIYAPSVNIVKIEKMFENFTISID